MQSALDDIDLVDTEPGETATAQVVEPAVQRLVALAERAADTYSAPVIEHLSELVNDARLVTLLAPLRIVAGWSPAYRSRVLSVAVSTLRKAPGVEAGRCLVDLAASFRLELLGPPTFGTQRLLAHWASRDGAAKVSEEELMAELRSVSADEWEQAVADAERDLSRLRDVGPNDEQT